MHSIIVSRSSHVLQQVSENNFCRYNYQRNATFPAVLAAIVSSFGGLLFGYVLSYLFLAMGAQLASMPDSIAIARSPQR